jgi:glycosyltransferase involved in cell wall biosynthesis
MNALHLFYDEPDPDRWIPGDRHLRRLVRRIVRGKSRPGGQKLVFLNLCAGLDRLGVSYRSNDYRSALRSSSMPVGIIGKPHLLEAYDWKNPILFGASIMSHPLADPGLLNRHPNIHRILVPGEWMRTMCKPYWGDRVHAWPVGIDTDRWNPADTASKDVDFILYDKVRWDHEHYERDLLAPIRESLRSRGLSFVEIRYGHYLEEGFQALLRRARGMIFLCEHETQGLAYQQALACGVPLLAWDRGGCWRDPEYYPERVRFEPVSAVPYWDERCGLKFSDAASFGQTLDQFASEQRADQYRPRDYVMENLTLEHCARKYLDQWEAAFGERAPII